MSTDADAETDEGAEEVDESSEVSDPLKESREERFKSKVDYEPARRLPFERDVDRILASRAFARLGRVTQVAMAHDTLPLHNRYTHSVRVASLARRIANRLLEMHGGEPCDEGTVADHLSPDVVEAAGLAHDMGHPPFGHIGEIHLERLVKRIQPEGFEGNAQTFRHLTRLAEHPGADQGLGLTRATLRAVLKYPTFRKMGTPEGLSREDGRPPQFGAYHDDEEAFEFAMGYGPPSSQQSLEASIMDIADDIAYGIHDLEDFYRADFIPMDRILLQLQQAQDIRRYKVALQILWERQPEGRADDASLPPLEEILTGAEDGEQVDQDGFGQLLADFPSWSDTELEVLPRSRDWTLSLWRSRTVRYFMESIQLEYQEGFPIAVLSGEAAPRMDALKLLTRTHVHSSARLRSQQAGLGIITTLLFDWLCPSTNGGDHVDTIKLTTIATLLPRWARRLAEDILKEKRDEVQSQRWVRLVADVVAFLDDSEAVRLAHRIQGTASGSVRDTVW